MLSWIKQTFTSTPPPAVLLQSAPQANLNPPTSTSTPQKVNAPAKEEEQTEISYRTSKLIMVTANNNNKFYEMKEQKDGNFKVTYGRIGTTGTSRTYPMNQWDQKHNEKIRKGYVDQTHLFINKKKEEENDDLLIDDAAVQSIISELMAYANKSIQYNYNVSADQVTRLQVEEAQTILDNLVARVKSGMRARYFNDKLLALYQVIPRRMTNVKEYLISTPKTADDLKTIHELLAKEQATLDVMRGQVEINEKQQSQQKEASQTIQKMDMLTAMGIQMEQVKDKKLIQSIKKMMGDNSKKFKRAFKVCNLRTQLAFDHHLTNTPNKSTQLFWHGSRNENWLSIMKSGLVLHPASAVITGKMFGYGLYFADKFQKSLNYTSLRGSYWANGRQNKAFLALYDVHVGEQLKIKKHQPWCGQLSKDNLKNRGAKYDSLYAQGGADLLNNEYIVYNETQCTIRYIVEVG